MKTVLEEAPKQTATDLAFPVKEFDIAAIRPTVMALKINGIEDKEGQKLVHEWRMKCRKMRTGIESTREEFKRVWLEGGRKVDAEAKRLQAELEPLEQHCIAEEEKIEAELERIETAKQDVIYADRLARWRLIEEPTNTKRDYLLSFTTEAEFTEHLQAVAERVRLRKEDEARQAEARETLRLEQEELKRKQAEFEAQQAAERAAREKVRNRMNALAIVRCYPDEETVAAMSDEAFELFRVDKLNEWMAAQEATRQAEEIAKRNAARMSACAAVRYYPNPDKVAAMTDEGFAATLEEATQLWNAQKQREADELAEQQRIAEENAERIRQENLQRAREEAAEQSRIETEARIERERQVAEQQRIAEEAKSAKEAALRPAKQQLYDFAGVIGRVPQPQISTEVDRKVLTLINNIQKSLSKIADELE